MNKERTLWIAFAGANRVAKGDPRHVAAAVKILVDGNAEACVLVFDAYSSEPVELDLRGSVNDVVARLPPVEGDRSSSESVELVGSEPEQPLRARSAGRPKLGVVAREVTLLPRHWAWLATQSGGASVVLRKLVEQALRASADGDRARMAKESTYRFMTAVAGNEPNHEEAIRALFAGDLAMFGRLIDVWPTDIREHCLLLARAEEREE